MLRPIPAGTLRHQIVFERPNYTQDPQSGEVTAGAQDPLTGALLDAPGGDDSSNEDSPEPAFVTVATRRASIRPISGRQFYEAAQTQVDVSHTIRIRHTPEITADMRIRFGTRIFEIVNPHNPEELNRETVLLVRERVAGDVKTTHAGADPYGLEGE